MVVVVVVVDERAVGLGDLRHAQSWKEYGHETLMRRIFLWTNNMKSTRR